MAEGLVSIAYSGLDNSARADGFAKGYLTCMDCQLAPPSHPTLQTVIGCPDGKVSLSGRTELGTTRPT